MRGKSDTLEGAEIDVVPLPGDLNGRGGRHRTAPQRDSAPRSMRRPAKQPLAFDERRRPPHALARHLRLKIGVLRRDRGAGASVDSDAGLEPPGFRRAKILVRRLTGGRGHVLDQVAKPLIEPSRGYREGPAGEGLLDADFPASGPLGLERWIPDFERRGGEVLRKCRRLEGAAEGCADAGRGGKRVRHSRARGKKIAEGVVVVEADPDGSAEPPPEIGRALQEQRTIPASAIERGLNVREAARAKIGCRSAFLSLGVAIQLRTSADRSPGRWAEIEPYSCAEPRDVHRAIGCEGEPGRVAG